MGASFRNRFALTLSLLAVAVLYPYSGIKAQIESDAVVPFTEEEESTYSTGNDSADAAEQPKPSNMDFVPAATIRDLNTSSNHFRILPFRQKDASRKSNVNTLVQPPAFIRDVNISSSYSSLLPENYLYHIASTHNWGRFPEGSWKRVRIIRGDISSGVVKKHGAWQSSMDYTVTLSKVLPEQYTLTTETTPSRSVRKFAAPTTTDSNYWDDSAKLKPVSFKSQDDLELEIEGVSYPCSWEQIIFENNEKRVEIKTWRSDFAAHLPQILRQERKVYIKTPEKKELLAVSSLYKLSPTSIPYSVMGKVHYVWQAEQTEESSQGKTVTVSLISLNVPGEVISFEKRLYSPQGTLIGQTIGQMVDYGLKCSKNRASRALFNLRSWRRSVPLPTMPEE